MQLCSNRPEGFGPHSSMHGQLPTTCFLDIIVVPLSVWIYLALLAFIALPLFLLSHFRSSSSVPKSAFFNPSSDGNDVTSRARPRWLLLTVRILYYFLVIAIIAMVSLEIARLETAELGIGLLPFQYVGVVIAAIVHSLLLVAAKRRKAGKSRSASSGVMVEKLVIMAGTLFWLMLTITWALKIATYAVEGIYSRDGMVPQDAYRVVDEVTDLGVMVLLGLLEVLFEGLALAGIA